MASSDDPSLTLNEQIVPIPPDKNIDVKKYLRTFIEAQKTDPAYSILEEGMAEVQTIHEEMQVQYLASDCGRKHLALRSKSFANHLMTVAISCCARNTLKIMSWEIQKSSFMVTEDDIKTAATLCRWSNHILTSFNVNNVERE